MRISDWSSDVCSSDLSVAQLDRVPASEAEGRGFESLRAHQLSFPSARATAPQPESDIFEPVTGTVRFSPAQPGHPSRPPQHKSSARFLRSRRFFIASPTRQPPRLARPLPSLQFVPHAGVAPEIS